MLPTQTASDNVSHHERRKKSLLSKMSPLITTFSRTLKRKKSSDTFRCQDRLTRQSHQTDDNTASHMSSSRQRACHASSSIPCSGSPLGQSIVGSGNLLARSNSPQMHPDIEFCQIQRRFVVNPTSAGKSSTTSAFSSGFESSDLGNASSADTGLTTPESQRSLIMNGNGMRAGILPSPSPEDTKTYTLSSSSSHRIKWSESTKGERPSAPELDSAAAPWADPDSRMIARLSPTVLRYDGQRAEFRKSSTPWSEGRLDLTERARQKQKQVLASPPSSLPIDLQHPAPSVSRRKPSSSKGKYFVEEFINALPTPRSPPSDVQKLSWATENVSPAFNPSHDPWNETPRKEQLRQRRELASVLSTYNLNRAVLERSQPPVEESVGPLNEVLYPQVREQSLRERCIQFHATRYKESREESPGAKQDDAISPNSSPIRSARATLPPTVKEEPGEEELSSSEVSTTDADGDADSESSASFACISARESSSNLPVRTVGKDSARPSLKSSHSIKNSAPKKQQQKQRLYSESIDLDALATNEAKRAKHAKAASYEKMISRRTSPSANRSNAMSPNGYEIFRTNSRAEGALFLPCEDQCRRGQ